MVTAVNRVYQHEGHDYHLQAEDLGTEAGCFEARVYDGGNVLWSRRVPYDDAAKAADGPIAFEESVHAQMNAILLTVQAAIARGRIQAGQA